MISSGYETVLGLGHDLVSIPDFVEGMVIPGTRTDGLFSVREQRQSQDRAQIKGDAPERHLAARWAGKEAVLKAWSEALGDNPPPYSLDNFPWNLIEILDDRRGRPGVYLSQEVQTCLQDSLLVRTAEAPIGVEEGWQSEGLTKPRKNSEGSSRFSHPGQFESGCLSWHISLSHDGDTASAVVLLCRQWPDPR